MILSGPHISTINYCLHSNDAIQSSNSQMSTKWSIWCPPTPLFIIWDNPWLTNIIHMPMSNDHFLIQGTGDPHISPINVFFETLSRTRRVCNPYEYPNWKKTPMLPPAWIMVISSFSSLSKSTCNPKTKLEGPLMIVASFQMWPS